MNHPGWGNGFSQRTLNPIASADNLGLNGATAPQLSSLEAIGPRFLMQSRPTFHQSVFMLQFNLATMNKEQVCLPLGTMTCTLKWTNKRPKMITFIDVPIKTYTANMNKLISDAKTAGAIPIVVSSLSRRFFKKDGTISDSLKPYADAALALAKSAGVHSIDLHQASITYLQKIGPTAAHRLDLAKGDETHLNDNGSIVFGRMVADLINAAYPAEMAGVFKANKTLSTQIADGVPSF